MQDTSRCIIVHIAWRGSGSEQRLFWSNIQLDSYKENRDNYLSEYTKKKARAEITGDCYELNEWMVHVLGIDWQM